MNITDLYVVFSQVIDSFFFPFKKKTGEGVKKEEE